MEGFNVFARFYQCKILHVMELDYSKADYPELAMK